MEFYAPPEQWHLNAAALTEEADNVFELGVQLRKNRAPLSVWSGLFVAAAEMEKVAKELRIQQKIARPAPVVELAAGEQEARRYGARELALKLGVSVDEGQALADQINNFQKASDG